MISTTSNMNGVSDYIADRKEKYKNILTIAYSGSVGVTFYQEKYVFVGETVFALLPKFKMNKYSGLFIATVFNFYNKIFSYGRKIIGTRYKNYSIKLPTKEDGKLDLEYMENYMKKLQFSDLI